MSGIVSMIESKLRETLLGLKSVSKHFDLYVVDGQDYDIVVRNPTTHERQRISFDTSCKARVCDVIASIYYDSTEYARYTMRQALQGNGGCAKLEIRGGIITEAYYIENEHTP